MATLLISVGSWPFLRHIWSLWCGIQGVGPGLTLLKVPNLPVRPVFQETFQAVQQNGELARQAQDERRRVVRTARLRWRLLPPVSQQAACPCRGGPPRSRLDNVWLPAYCVHRNRAGLRTPWRSLPATYGSVPR